MQNSADDLDKRVRAEVYEATMRRGAPPRSSEVAEALKLDQRRVRDSFRRLAEAHVLVLQPELGEILMANPFSAVPTPFQVESSGLSAYGNCIWDALGIPAMLNADATIHTSCADCGVAIQIQVARGSVSGKGLLHFAIPAREWWNDIVFT
jgi:hypothetical protein